LKDFARKKILPHKTDDGVEHKSSAGLHDASTLVELSHKNFFHFLLASFPPFFEQQGKMHNNNNQKKNNEIKVRREGGKEEVIFYNFKNNQNSIFDCI